MAAQGCGGNIHVYRLGCCGLCATALWIIGIAGVHYEPVKRPAGERKPSGSFWLYACYSA
jgi:hypothetical protein